MTFKSKWEKATQYSPLPSLDILGMLAQAFPNSKIASHEILPGGCANVNVKVLLVGNSEPFILRVYLRDKDAAFREAALAKLLKSNIPVPRIRTVGEYHTYRYAVVEYMHGITLRDLLLGQEPHDLNAVMYEVGTYLAKIQSYGFGSSGFFDNDLVPKDPLTKRGYKNYALRCLKEPQFLSQLDSNLIRTIESCLKKYGTFFPPETEMNLVHGDFDPANILVDQVNGKWTVSGILDWEFAFSGSMLCDVANMLRYSHEVPPAFEEAFLRGLKKSGISLHDSWRISVDILNLLSLLDCLVRSDRENRPNQVLDISTLIRYITAQLEMR